MARLIIMTPSHSVGGGVERILEDLHATLADAGHDVRLALPRSPHSDPGRFLALHGTGLPVVEVPIEASSRRSSIRQLTSFLRREQPDLVISARVFDLYPAVASLKSRVPSPPRLISMVYVYEAPLLWDLRQWGSAIDGVAVDARLIADATVELAEFPAERVERLPGPVEAPRRMRRSRTGPIRIGYVGRLEQAQKRALDLIPFVAELARLGMEFELVIAGTGSVEAELKQRIAGNYGGAVRFLGWKSRDELYQEVYPELDVLVHFAEWEGVTVAPREAMAHGAVPVISRFTGLGREGFFREGENCLIFEPGDVAGAAAHVRTLAADSSRLDALSEEASTSRRDRYSSEGVGVAWAEFVERILGMPLRTVEGDLPDIAPSGRLERLGAPQPIVDFVRRITGRPVTFRRASDEWPHTSGTAPRSWYDTVEQFASEGDRQ